MTPPPHRLINRRTTRLAVANHPRAAELEAERMDAITRLAPAIWSCRAQSSVSQAWPKPGTLAQTRRLPLRFRLTLPPIESHAQSLSRLVTAWLHTYPEARNAPEHNAVKKEPKKPEGTLAGVSVTNGQVEPSV